MELYDNIKVSTALAPKAAVTNDTAFVSEIVDTANFNDTVFIGTTGTNADADATYTVLVEDGDNSALSDNAAVADAYLEGTEAGIALTYASDNKSFKIGYKGPKRYVRVTITPSNNTGNAFMSGVWVQSGARKVPFTTQTA